MIQENDTLYLNYNISSGEFGGRNEGIMIYFKNDVLNATGVRYNKLSTPHILDAFKDFDKKYKHKTSLKSGVEMGLCIRQHDSLTTSALVEFYKNHKNCYTILKSEWVLSNDQREYIIKILNEIKSRPIEENAFSNASEHYAILTKNEYYVFIDRTGSWNKFIEIRKIMGIEQQHRKL